MSSREPYRYSEASLTPGGLLDPETAGLVQSRWDGRREYPVRAAKLALLSALVAGAISVEGVQHGWYSIGNEIAISAGSVWLVVPASAGLAALGSYLWALAWRYGGVSATRRKVPGDRLLAHHGAGHVARWDREVHALLQGASAAAGGVATFFVIPGGSGVGDGAIGSILPPVLMAAILEKISPSGLVVWISGVVTISSWIGWRTFADDGPVDQP